MDGLFSEAKLEAVLTGLSTHSFAPLGEQVTRIGLEVQRPKHAHENSEVRLLDSVHCWFRGQRFVPEKDYSEKTFWHMGPNRVEDAEYCLLFLLKIRNRTRYKDPRDPR
jgi:hypothetical protein